MDFSFLAVLRQVGSVLSTDSVFAYPTPQPALTGFSADTANWVFSTISVSDVNSRIVGLHSPVTNLVFAFIFNPTVSS